MRNGLVSFYIGCREVSDGVKVFDGMSDRDVMLWTAVIDGFIDNGRALEGLWCFMDIEMEGFVANDVTIVSVLRARAKTGALSIGVKLDELVKLRRNKEAIELFERIESVGLRPDEKTMIVVLSTYRNIGWVDEGLTYFKKIRKVYKLRPTMLHYGCVVDLLARSLIWGCKVYGDTKRLEDLIKHIKGEKIDSCDDCETYVLLGDGSSFDEWGDYGMAGDDYERPPIFDDGQFKDELEMGDYAFVIIGKEMASNSKMPEAMFPLLEEFSDVFHDELPDALPPLCNIQHHINLEPSSQLPNMPHYRLCPGEHEELHRQVEEFVSNGHIRKIMSTLAQPRRPLDLMSLHDSGSVPNKVDEKRNCQRYNIYREAAFLRVKTSVRSLNLEIASPGRSSDRGGNLSNRTEARNEI
nr:hypothetical protein [Tanacetum cinerariifolium]